MVLTNICDVEIIPEIELQYLFLMTARRHPLAVMRDRQTIATRRKASR
jgi:hypothetical protein